MMPALPKHFDGTECRVAYETRGCPDGHVWPSTTPLDLTTEGRKKDMKYVVEYAGSLHGVDSFKEALERFPGGRIFQSTGTTAVIHIRDLSSRWNDALCGAVSINDTGWTGGASNMVHRHTDAYPANCTKCLREASRKEA